MKRRRSNLLMGVCHSQRYVLEKFYSDNPWDVISRVEKLSQIFMIHVLQHHRQNWSEGDAKQVNDMWMAHRLHHPTFLKELSVSRSISIRLIINRHQFLYNNSLAFVASQIHSSKGPSYEKVRQRKEMKRDEKRWKEMKRDSNLPALSFLVLSPTWELQLDSSPCQEQEPPTLHLLLGYSAQPWILSQGHPKE